MADTPPIILMPRTLPSLLALANRRDRLDHRCTLWNEVVMLAADGHVERRLVAAGQLVRCRFLYLIHRNIEIVTPAIGGSYHAVLQMVAHRLHLSPAPV